MRHYPDTDTLEIDEPMIRSTAADGGVTIASARRAVSNGDATQVQLQGGARVLREATATAAAIEFESEFLHAFLDTERVKSHLPVRLRQPPVNASNESQTPSRMMPAATTAGMKFGPMPA